MTGFCGHCTNKSFTYEWNFCTSWATVSVLSNISLYVLMELWTSSVNVIPIVLLWFKNRELVPHRKWGVGGTHSCTWMATKKVTCRMDGGGVSGPYAKVSSCVCGGCLPLLHILEVPNSISGPNGLYDILKKMLCKSMVVSSMFIRVSAKIWVRECCWLNQKMHRSDNEEEEEGEEAWLRCINMQFSTSRFFFSSRSLCIMTTTTLLFTLSQV